MYFHPKLAWPPATYDVISRSHSNWPSLNLSNLWHPPPLAGLARLTSFFRHRNCVGLMRRPSPALAEISLCATENLASRPAFSYEHNDIIRKQSMSRATLSPHINHIIIIIIVTTTTIIVIITITITNIIFVVIIIIIIVIIIIFIIIIIIIIIVVIIFFFFFFFFFCISYWASLYCIG